MIGSSSSWFEMTLRNITLVVLKSMDMAAEIGTFLFSDLIDV